MFTSCKKDWATRSRSKGGGAWVLQHRVMVTKKNNKTSGFAFVSNVGSNKVHKSPDDDHPPPPLCQQPATKITWPLFKIEKAQCDVARTRCQQETSHVFVRRLDQIPQKITGAWQCRGRATTHVPRKSRWKFILPKEGVGVRVWSQTTTTTLGDSHGPLHFQPRSLNIRNLPYQSRCPSAVRPKLVRCLQVLWRLCHP